MKIRPVGVELFRADGQTEGRADGRTEEEKARQTCRNILAHLHFCKAPTQNAIRSYTTPKNDRVLGRNTQCTYLYISHSKVASNKVLLLHTHRFGHNDANDKE
jgi:hypothetical protein